MHLDEGDLARKYWATFYVVAVLANAGENIAVLTRYRGEILNLPMLMPQFQPLGVSLLRRENVAYLIAANKARGNLSSLTLGLTGPGWNGQRNELIAKIQATIFCASPVAVISLPDHANDYPSLGGL